MCRRAGAAVPTAPALRHGSEGTRCRYRIVVPCGRHDRGAPRPGRAVRLGWSLPENPEIRGFGTALSTCWKVVTTDYAKAARRLSDVPQSRRRRSVGARSAARVGVDPVPRPGLSSRAGGTGGARRPDRAARLGWCLPENPEIRGSRRTLTASGPCRPCEHRCQGRVGPDWRGRGSRAAAGELALKFLPPRSALGIAHADPRTPAPLLSTPTP